ncbi:MAG: hypothetical protein ACFFCZ_28985 [Promethearchaeota archaeon]
MLNNDLGFKNKVNPEVIAGLADFLRIRGRFKEIELEDTERQVGIIAKPLFPDSAALIAYTTPRNESVIVEIQGSNSNILQEECINFLNLHDLKLNEVQTFFNLPDEVTVIIQGSPSSPYDQKVNIIRETLQNIKKEIAPPKIRMNFILQKLKTPGLMKTLNKSVNSSVVSKPSKIMKRTKR